MASAASNVPPVHNSEEILRQVRQFVKGCTYEVKIPSDELARSALFLLRNLPSARQAVLEHLCNVLDDAVDTHFHNLNMGTANAAEANNPMETVIDDIQGALMGFVKNNPEAWAPIISAWSIDLLGSISSKYTNIRGVPPSSSLNEMLQMWMTCKPTKTLIEIASECFASMVGDAPNVCVDALLEASVKHSPHFDWVVAHIGSCFPKTIINRVLMCGLKDFCHGDQQPASGASTTEEKIPKMTSVVGILGHLAGHHGRNIRDALLSLFHKSMKPDQDEMFRSTVPFLLHLASLSPLLLRAIAMDAISVLTPSVVNQLATQFAQKSTSEAGQDANNMVNLVVHLLTRMEDESPKVLQFVMSIAFPDTGSGEGEPMETNQSILPAVRMFCVTVLTHLIADLHLRAHTKASDATADIPCLSALQSHVNSLCRQLVTSGGERYAWMSQLLACLAIYSRESITTDILSQLLLQAQNDKQLSLFVQIQQECQIKYPDVLVITVQKVLDQFHMGQSAAEAISRGLSNVLNLLTWEDGAEARRRETRCLLTHVIQRHLAAICDLLSSSSVEVVTIAIQILELVAIPARVDQITITRLCGAVATCLFSCLHLKEGPKKMKCCVSCQKVLQKLCNTGSCARKMILRFLLEGALSPDHAPAFGSKVADPGASSQSTLQPLRPSLLESNRKQGTGFGLTRGHVTVFHAGVIGQGLKPPARNSPFSKEDQTHNRQILVDTLTSCGSHGNQSGQSDAMETSPATNEMTEVSGEVTEVLAKLMVELVTPDVMYNAIVPWPEEEFMKITVERDLLIKKKFEENDFLWDIMDFLTKGQYCMCHCSVLTRAVMATLLSHWESSRDKSARNSPWHLNASCRIIQCLSKGQLLPPPLCYCSEILHLLTPYEVYLILLNIWRYMKENPPLPEPARLELSKQVCHPRFTELLRSILHKNIPRLGQFYPRFFGLKPQT